MSLKPHPRLYVGRERLEDLRRRPRRAPVAAAWDAVAERAEVFVRSNTVGFDPNRHNALLVRAHGMQDRMVTLLRREGNFLQRLVSLQGSIHEEDLPWGG